MLSPTNINHTKTRILKIIENKKIIAFSNLLFIILSINININMSNKMLIKVYPKRGIPPEEVYILEDCTNIRVDHNIHPYSHHGDLSDISSVYYFNNEGDVFFSGTYEKPVGTCHIDFLRGGVKIRLLVSNYAYICNDQGKTIEKVSV